MSEQNEKSPSVGPSEKIVVRLEVEREGRPAETITEEFEGAIDRPRLAGKVASILELEAEEILEELSKPECFHPERHHGTLKLVCVDLHFETEEKRHHFLPKAKWERVHRWGCKYFRIAVDACANLELHSGSPEGPVLNESKEIGHHRGCLHVWLVKPGPEKNG
jgi:hypothetical protein